MDPKVVDTLNAAVRKVLEMPEVAGKLTGAGNTVRMESAEQFRATVKADRARWAQVVKQAGVTLD
jgi:tripartite-type tricarboxylate transporter receptor subunit TctC